MIANCYIRSRVFGMCRVPRRKYNVLGIESSCDDTGAAVVTDTGRILGEGHFSQLKIHNECGGILPHIAQELHSVHLEEVVSSAMKESCLQFQDIKAIAVTVSPGLILSLREGVKYAKHLCLTYNRPLIPIHHMEAHALTVRMMENVKFPFLCLLISGGHSILSLVMSVNEFHTLGQSANLSPGQVFDKVARRMKLSNIKKLRGLCGGEAIERAALEGDPTAIPFTERVLARTVNCVLDFNTFRTRANQYIASQEQNLGLGPDEVIPDYADLCASMQWGLTRHLCQRLELAIMYLEANQLLQGTEKSLVVSGGVASNHFIRKAFKYVCDHYEYKLVVPPRKLCTDNGTMIAWNGIEKLKENHPLVLPHELDSVVPLASCELGINISHNVRHDLQKMRMRKYIKLQKFISEYKEEMKKLEVET